MILKFGDYLEISPPIEWAHARRRPELNGHMKHPHVLDIRISGAHDRDDGGYGYPWDCTMTPGDIDRVTIAYLRVPEPEGYARKIVREVQRLVDRYPDRDFRGYLNLYLDDDALELYRRVTVKDRRAVLQRPVVIWAEDEDADV